MIFKMKRKNSRIKMPFHEISIVFFEEIYNIKYMFTFIMKGLWAENEQNI